MTRQLPEISGMHFGGILKSPDILIFSNTFIEVVQNWMGRGQLICVWNIFARLFLKKSNTVVCIWKSNCSCIWKSLFKCIFSLRAYKLNIKM